MSPTQTPAEIQERIERIDQALRTLAWWLVEAQTGFAERDARRIEDILDLGASERGRAAS